MGKIVLHLEQESANLAQGPNAATILVNKVLVNKVLLGHSHAHLFTYWPCPVLQYKGRFCYDMDCAVHGTQNICYLVCHRKNLLTRDLEHCVPVRIKGHKMCKDLADGLIHMEPPDGTAVTFLLLRWGLCASKGSFYSQERLFKGCFVKLVLIQCLKV